MAARSQKTEKASPLSGWLRLRGRLKVAHPAGGAHSALTWGIYWFDTPETYIERARFSDLRRGDPRLE